MRKIYLFLGLVTFLVSNAVKAQLPTKCFEIQSILVDACGTPEGVKEMVRFQIGSNPLNTSTLTTVWGQNPVSGGTSNPWRGICSNAGTASRVSYLNTTIAKCGFIKEPIGGVIPANAKVILVTSDTFDVFSNPFTNLTDTIYMIFQCRGNTGGHFVNFNNTPNTLRRKNGNRKSTADKLMAEGYNAEPLHGDLSQAQRDRVMDKFRQRTLQILVATDVAARGIDVTDITHVIHYNLPEDVENYTHRSGRTARAGKKGVSLALVNTKELFKIKSIEKIIKSSFNLKSIPTPDQICEIRLMHMVSKVADAPVDKNRMDKFMPSVMEKLDVFSKEELVQRFVSGEFNRLLNYYSPLRAVSEFVHCVGNPAETPFRFCAADDQERFAAAGKQAPPLRPGISTTSR